MLASFSPSASDSGSSGVAYPASGNFTSCKDKKEEGAEKRRVQRRGEERRAVCSWKTLRVPVILAEKEIDEEEKEETRKYETTFRYPQMLFIKEEKPPPSPPSPPSRPPAHYWMNSAGD